MTVSLVVSSAENRGAYAVPAKALRRWVAERLRRDVRADGSVAYEFALSGSTCTNRPLDVVMSVVVGADGTIRSATSRPADGDAAGGCDAMCAAAGDGRRFLADVGDCPDAIGLTLDEAAFRDWQPDSSGCFCTAGNRRHKWRNVFQALHYAAAHERE